MKILKVVIPIIVMIMAVIFCKQSFSNPSCEYGVYLSSTYDELPTQLSCETLVIDAQSFSEKEISELHKNNKKIYSYINVGAIENFRDYYDENKELALGPYENWPEEEFIDVSQASWREFIVDNLAEDLKSKGIDGYFVDNTDVYYQYKTEDNFEGLTKILTGLKSTGLEVIINGGDVFVSEYLSENGDLHLIADGVNQEGVYSKINWEDNTFTRNAEEDTEYYLEYLAKVRDVGAKVFIIEYSQDSELVEQIIEECEKHGFIVYISDSLELD